MLLQLFQFLSAKMESTFKDVTYLYKRCVLTKIIHGQPFSVGQEAKGAGIIIMTGHQQEPLYAYQLSFSDPKASDCYPGSTRIFQRRHDHIYIPVKTPEDLRRCLEISENVPIVQKYGVSEHF